MAETPLMKQYRDMKKQYAEAVLFFRLGDFYEMFDSDAVEVSALLNLTLTHKGDSPMCGIPYHAARNYIKRLLDAGKKIAICEQTQLSSSSKSLATREVVRVITPATVVEEDFLDDGSFNYILSVFRQGCAFCDVSTGDFRLRVLEGGRIPGMRDVIEQLMPREILVCEDEYFVNGEFKAAIDGAGCMVTKLPPWYFTQKTSYKTLCEHAGVNSLSAFGIGEDCAAVAPAGALLKYVKETAKDSVSHLVNYRLEDNAAYLGMDESSRRNLELFSNLHDGTSRHTLCEAVNRCRTSSGTRLLKSWLAFPLRNIEQIKFRQGWVGFFRDNPAELDRVRNSIGSAMDLNRLTSRVQMKRAVPRDLSAIKQSVGTFFDIVSGNAARYSELFEPVLKDDANLQRAADFMRETERAVNPEFLGQFNEGEVILSGYDAELDRLRMLKDSGDEVLKAYLEEEKAKTGLTILKLGYNRVFGYYLEIPNGQLSKAPDYFQRKQTLVNGERFTTEKLREYEQAILRAAAEAGERELYLYEALLNKALSLCPVLNAMGSFMSSLDVFQGLARLAVECSYVCPEVTEEDVLEIRGGRHPVVERELGAGKFVANDLDMSTRFCLITGPNMAGKSTYLRQNALIVLLAHTGSCVPASYAKVGITDRLFCRVGASDNLARGESTFLVEMQEAAFILRNSTERSFVIIDEIGRGTSTQDGMSIAWAIMKDLTQRRPKTLFATHYHELTMTDIQNIRLLTLEVEESNGSVTFLRRVKDGVANSSYGIHVAKLAGIPYPVIREAKAFQHRHFADYGINQQSLFASGDSPEDAVPEVNTEALNELAAELKGLDPDRLTPMQALVMLSKLKDMAEAL